MEFTIRPFRPEEGAAVNALALSAFAEYRQHYTDWEAIAHHLGNMAALAASGELLVAAWEGGIAGAVVYVAPHRPKQAFFPPEWPILRMLVSAPSLRGQGIGRALTEACIARARRDGAPLIALHTSPIMQVALPLYLRMGFVLEREAPTLWGVPYAIYVKRWRAAD